MRTPGSAVREGWLYIEGGDTGTPGVAQGGSTGTMCTCVPGQNSCPMQQGRLSQLSGTRHMMFFYPCQSLCQDLHVWNQTTTH